MQQFEHPHQSSQPEQPVEFANLCQTDASPTGTLMTQDQIIGYHRYKINDKPALKVTLRDFLVWTKR
jgi:hypothetical protein